MITWNGDSRRRIPESRAKGESWTKGSKHEDVRKDSRWIFDAYIAPTKCGSHFDGSSVISYHAFAGDVDASSAIRNATLCIPSIAQGIEFRAQMLARLIESERRDATTNNIN